MEVRVLLPQPFGAWDCAAWSSPWQGEFQAGAIPAGSTSLRSPRSGSRRLPRHSPRSAGDGGLTSNDASYDSASHLARWRSRQRSSLIRRRSRVRFPLEPPVFRSVAEQQLQRAVNAPPSRAAKVRVLPLRPFSPAKRRQRRILLVSGRAERKSPCRIQFFCGRGGTVYAPERESGERKLVRVRLPLSAPI